MKILGGILARREGVISVVGGNPIHAHIPQFDNQVSTRYIKYYVQQYEIIVTIRNYLI